MPGRIVGLCPICSVKDAIYRCPGCSITYCSLNCYKKHQADAKCVGVKVKTETAPEKAKVKSLPPLLHFTEEEEEKDRVKRATLAKLGESDHLKNMLASKHLQAMLTDIDNSLEPDKHLESAMQIPIFTEFVDECMRVVDNQQPGA